MKNYNSYMERQSISPEAHEALLNLKPGKRRSNRPWARYGALAACAVLMLGVGTWRLTSSAPGGQTVQNALYPGIKDCYGPGEIPPDSASVPEDVSLPGGTVILGDWDSGFVVNSPAEEGKQMFPMIPGILYPDRTGNPESDASRVYAPGSFTVDLTKEDIQTIFWGPEGKPEASHPKTEQGDLPWMLFWDGYFLHGRALYDGQGQLFELTLWGTQGRASFELELCLGALPFSCAVDLDRGDQISEFNGVSIAGWSKVYDRDGDGQDDYICGSEFMTKNDIGVRFVNQNSAMQAEYGDEESAAFQDMDLEGSCLFNSLFVRQALTGGLYLDHLASAESVPAWREEEFSSLAQARQEADFAPYLPTANLEGYGEFYGRLSYQEGSENMLFVRWSRGYDNVEVAVYRDGYHTYYLADPDEPETYDLSLYPIPWCDSVPWEYWDTVNDPAFQAEDMSLALVEARGREHDTGGMTYSFDMLHPDGTLVSYRCDGLTAEQVWALVEETL